MRLETHRQGFPVGLDTQGPAQPLPPLQTRKIPHQEKQAPAGAKQGQAAEPPIPAKGRTNPQQPAPAGSQTKRHETERAAPATPAQLQLTNSDSRSQEAIPARQGAATRTPATRLKPLAETEPAAVIAAGNPAAAAARKEKLGAPAPAVPDSAAPAPVAEQSRSRDTIEHTAAES